VEYSDPYRIRYSSCPMCDTGAPAVLRDEDWSWRPDYRAELPPIIRWMVCTECGHQFTWGYHDQVGLRILFDHAQPGQTAHGMTAAHIEASRPVWVSLLESVTARCYKGRWLDVGAGAGMLLALARECGFDVCALEARESVADALQSRGIEVLSHDIDALLDGPAGAYDVITMCDVLEHLPFPCTALRAVTHALRPGGVLTISCPNRDALAWTALNEEGLNPYWAEIEHAHNFSFRQLRELLEREGYQRMTCSVSPRYRVCMEIVASKTL
jgi:protein O-GlcNAc transferase